MDAQTADFTVGFMVHILAFPGVVFPHPFNFATMFDIEVRGREKAVMVY